MTKAAPRSDCHTASLNQKWRWDVKIVFISFTLTLLLGLSTGLRSQEAPSPRLAAVRDATGREILKKMPGWVRKAIPPIQGSTDIIIDQWESGDSVVKITFEIHSSQKEAAESFERGKQHLRVEEDATKARGKHDFRLITDVTQSRSP